MNVAALLQDSPSDDHDNRRRLQQQRDREQQQREREQQQRDREREQHQAAHHIALHDRDRPPPHPHLSPSQQSTHSSSSLSPLTSRHLPPPSSPHRSYPPQDYSHAQRVSFPPPSTLLSTPYEHKSRRPEPEQPRMPEQGAHIHHAPPTSIAQPYTLEHRPLQPQPRTHQGSHSHAHPHQHAHTNPSTPSPMYMPPPNRPGPLHSSSIGPPKLGPGTSPTGPGMPPPGHGSIPLYPTPVGPGVPPGMSPLSMPNPGPGIPPSRPLRSPHGYMEPSPMYGGHSPGVPASDPQHLHSQRPRTGGSYDFGRRSPVMGSLQRPPPFERDERDRDRDRDRSDRERERERDAALRSGPRAPPHSQFGMHPGSVHSSSTMAVGHGVGPSMNTRTPGPHIPPPQMLTGPGAMGMGAMMEPKQREHERERERTAAETRAGNVGESPGGRRERDRHSMKDKERERERDRPRERDADGFRPMIGPGMVNIEVEPERDWYRRTQAQNLTREQASDGQIWSRFAQPRLVGMPSSNSMAVEDERDRELRMMHERDRDRERRMLVEEMRMREIREFREHERFMEAEEARIRRAREAEWDAEKAGRFTRPVQGNRASAKEKIMREDEREREERRAGKAREEQVDEKGRRVQMPATWVKELEHEGEREREHAERMQKERNDMEVMRSVPQVQSQVPGQHHHHYHHHHVLASAAQQGHVHIPKPGKQIAPDSGAHPQTQQIIGPGMAQRDIQPLFGPSSEHIRQQNVMQYRQGASKMMDGPVAGPSTQVHVAGPPHQHPQTHLQYSLSATPIRQHPQVHGLADVPGAGAFVHRETPSRPYGTIPPNVSGPTEAMLFHRRSPSPRPPIKPKLPTVRLGTFIYPRTPFPFLDFPSVSYEAGAPEREPRQYRATILIPCGFLPTKRPAQPRIWGGAQVPALDPIPLSTQVGPPGASFSQPHPYDKWGTRRVYTDDSDLILCALHAGLLTWSGTRQAKSEGKDLRIEVKITREARFIGGFGSRFIKVTGFGTMQARHESEDDGSTLLSAGWGNSHDGAGIEILTAVFVQRGAAHSKGLRNRTQRIAEYSERRSVLCDAPRRSRKRRRVDSELLDDADSAVIFEVERSDCDLCTAHTITFGFGRATCKRKRSTKETAVSVDADIVMSSPARKRPRSLSPSETSATTTVLEQSGAIAMTLDEDSKLSVLLSKSVEEARPSEKPLSS